MIKANQLFNKAIQWLTILLLLALVLVLSYSLMNISGFLPMSTKIQFINTNAEFVIGGVQDEAVVTQTFIAHDDIEKISIKMATYMRDNPGEVSIRVFDVESGESISEQSIPAVQIVDNQFNEFKLNKIIPGNGRTYALEISGTTSNVLQSVGVWSSYENVYPDGYLAVGGYESDGDLLFSLIGSQYNSVAGQVMISVVIGLLILGSVLAWMLINSKLNRKPKA